jgi:restriction endonuclease S subunit
LREGEILSDYPIFVKREYFESIPRSHIKTGYFLFSIMASIGNIAVVPDDFTDCTANRAVGILIPRDIERLDVNYLLALFGSNFGISLLEKLTRGGIQKRTNLGDIERLKIPLPPFEIQRSLVIEIEKRRADAQRLRQEAEEEWEAAKTHFERQLL